MPPGPTVGKAMPAGARIGLRASEAKITNLRVLAEEEKAEYSFVIRQEHPIDLLFFRLMFTSLTPHAHEDEDPDDAMPVELLQRAFERLMYTLQDPSQKNFNARDYDENGNGYVGWGEFCSVFEKLKPKISLSLAERVFLTFERQGTSHVSDMISVFMLLTILLSSFCMVLQTVDTFQADPIGTAAPQPLPAFQTIENICLVIFCIDYCVRAATSGFVRIAIFDRDHLLALAVGDQQIELASAGWRLVTYLTKFTNIIDLLAILPALIEKLASSGIGGNVFMVLRLIRLTRILRLNPNAREPLIVIERTLKQSTKALYVLGFNLSLGVVVFGSLMYTFESGQWNPTTQSYQRLQWDSDLHSYELSDSPFKNIPTAFWWATVTVTTVGYGDLFPVTSMGFVTAVLTMLFSITILALPVGVMGGIFSATWESFYEQKREKAAMLHHEKAKITKATEKISPIRLHDMMLIEVWNERFFHPNSLEAWSEKDQGRPNRAEFLGQVRVKLELGSQPHKKLITMALEANPEIVERKVTGSIDIEYEWTPVAPSDIVTLQGTLRFVLKSANSLLNLNLTNRTNPFALVFCYPESPSSCPGPGQPSLMPAVWRSPAAQETCDPHWFAEHQFSFRWLKKQGTSSERLGAPVVVKPLAALPAQPSAPEIAMARLDQLAEGMREVTCDVRRLSQRIASLPAHRPQHH